MDLNLSIKRNGQTIDLAATLTAVAEAIKNYNATLVNDLEMIESAVGKVFAAHPGVAAFLKPTLVAFTMRELTVPVEAYQTLEKRVGEYIDAAVASGKLLHANKKAGYSLPKA
jgi:hypothetical protein